MEQHKNIVRPPFLKAGDKVALIAPAYWVAEEAVSEAAEILRSWGLVPVIGAHTNNLNVDAYSGTANERAADLAWALEDDDIKAIFCSRGGYGAIHLLRRVPQETITQHPKWLVGYGDISILLNNFVAAGVMCVHGPMSFQLAAQQEPSVSITREILFGTMPQYEIPGNPHNRCGHAEGILVGGNLSSYSPIAGSQYHIANDQDIILFVEEVEESLHAVDRLFYQLLFRLDFKHVKGVILGSFTSIKYDLRFGSVEQMLTAHLHDANIPVCCGFPVGGNSYLPLVEGAPVSLDVTMDKSVLTFNVEGARQECHIDKPETSLYR